MEKSKETITVLAGLRVVDADKFKELALPVVDATRKEVGCVRYDLLQDVVDPNAFFFIEEYVDEAAYVAHREMPYMAPFRQARESVLDKYLGLKVLSERK